MKNASVVSENTVKKAIYRHNKEVTEEGSNKTKLEDQCYHLREHDKIKAPLCYQQDSGRSPALGRQVI